MKTMLTGFLAIVILGAIIAGGFYSLIGIGILVNILTGFSASMATLICTGVLALGAFSYLLGTFIND